MIATVLGVRRKIHQFFVRANPKKTKDTGARVRARRFGFDSGFWFEFKPYSSLCVCMYSHEICRLATVYVLQWKSRF